MDKKQTKEPLFEEALEQLETLVETMESGELPLQELVVKFETGVKLMKTCQKRLKEAEMKIVKLRRDKDLLSLEPFDPENPQS